MVYGEYSAGGGGLPWVTGCDIDGSGPIVDFVVIDGDVIVCDVHATKRLLLGVPAISTSAAEYGQISEMVACCKGGGSTAEVGVAFDGDCVGCFQKRSHIAVIFVSQGVVCGV